MAVLRFYGVIRSLAVYYGQFWRRGRLERFYSQFLEEGDLAFDIGSHVGNRVRAWRRLGVRVVAVEPQPDFVWILGVLFGRDSDVAVEAKGVSAEPGRGSLFISTRTPTVSSGTREWIDEVGQSSRFSSVKWDRQVVVEYTTLDALIKEHGLPAFCKIDVEGGELSTLKGLSNALPALSFECVPAASERGCQCIDRLEELASYRYRYSPKETMQWQAETWSSPEEMKEFLISRPTDGASGDVYARRCAPGLGERNSES